MINLLSPQALAGGLRASTLVLRFALMFFLARTVSLETLGLFGLYWAALQLASTLLPMDVYAQTSRWLLEGKVDAGSLIARHLGFLFLAIFTLGPVATFVFSLSSESIEFILIMFFLLHLPVETIASEIGRLLVPLHKPLAANVILFVRSALWVMPLVFCLEIEIVSPKLLNILSFWLVGSLFSLIISYCVLYKFSSASLIPRLNIPWCVSAIQKSGIFLLSTFAFRSVLGVDRFIVENKFDLEVLGIYALFASVSLGVLGLIESGVSAWHFPRLVAAIQKHESAAVFVILKGFVKQNSVASFCLMLIILVAFPIAVYFFLDDIYWRNLDVFVIIVIGVLMYCLSMPFHYVIYGFSSDWMLLLIYSSAFIVMVIWAGFFMVNLGVFGAGAMLSLALTVIALLRVLVAFFLLRRLI